MRYYFTPMLDKMAKEHFGPNIPSIRELEQKTALALISTNPVMDYVAPLPENVIPVAGVHIKDPKPLPEVIILAAIKAIRLDIYWPKNNIQLP